MILVTMSVVASNIDYLERVPLFSQVNRQELQRFADACTRKQVGVGDILFLEGDVADCLYIIVSGRVRIERLSETGVSQVLATRTAGDVIGEMALIDGRRRSAQATAQTRCKFLCLSKADFQNQVLAEPTVCFAMMETLSLRMRESSQMLLDTRSKAVHERLHSYLKSQADESGWVRLEISQGALSDLLGCTREAVNRALSTLVQEGKIERTSIKMIRVVDL